MDKLAQKTADEMEAGRQAVARAKARNEAALVTRDMEAAKVDAAAEEAAKKAAAAAQKAADDALLDELTKPDEGDDVKKSKKK